MKNTAIIIILLCMVALGCTEEKAGKNELNIALGTEPPMLNSTKATDTVSGFVLLHVMEGLMRWDDQSKLAPGVAERYEITDTGATFHLRKDAKWSDGKPVTARDFVFSWRKVLEPATASEYAFIMYPIKNAEAINKGEKAPQSMGAVAMDDYTLEVTFEKPCGYFLGLTAFATYLPIREDFYNSRGGRYAAEAADLLFNGRFELSEWVHGASLQFNKNPSYWNKDAVRLEKINVPYITSDSRARFNLFRDGKIDIVGLDNNTYKEAVKMKYRIRKFTNGCIWYMEFNHRDGRLTRNANLRRAIQAVVDQKEIVDKVIATPGPKPAYTLFPSWLNGVHDKFQKEYPVSPTKPDYEAADRYLAKAREELGLDKIPDLIWLTGVSDTTTKESEYFQALFKNRLGIGLKIDKQIFKLRLAKMTSGDFDIVSAGWCPDFSDPMTFGDLFASWNENNRGRYDNPDYDRLVRIAQATADQKKRMDAMGDMQTIIRDDVAVLPTYEMGLVYIQSNRLKGVTRQVIGADPDFNYCWIEKED